MKTQDLPIGSKPSLSAEKNRRTGEKLPLIDLLNQRSTQHAEQDRMAANIARLKAPKSKKQQAHLLVQSLVRMIRGK